ncbi:hypothetical protein [Ramlibacter rhizophilus]|uniref:hypothetical protein n=1 Tax=Ramlibacter rhizophilus TaxID=1781167 RepID=UPI001432311A|nr:hypothetical protein [Ramlibacter rhizophilus]
MGNILWDGQTATWIDHERALGREGLPDVNKLAALVTMSGIDDRDIQRAAVGISLTLGEQAIREAEASCGDLNVSGFAQQVADRLGPLATRVLQRFPQPHDLFTEGDGTAGGLQ